MTTFSAFPAAEVEFKQDGSPFDSSQVSALLELVASTGASDLLAISHGWNNDMAEARALYEAFFSRLRARLDAGPYLADRRFAVMAILWPSKRFAERELIASGAASAASAIRLDDVGEALKDLQEALGASDTVAKIHALIPHLEDSRAARREFADLVRSLAPTSQEPDGDGVEQFFTLPGEEIMDRLGQPAPIAATDLTPGRGGAAQVGAGGASTPSAAGLGNLLSGALSAGRHMLNLSTYYVMKDRAGTVGRVGLDPALRQLRATRPNLRLHLVGHSFGGRLVTAAVAGAAGSAPLPASSLTLLQAAFSHNGFAQRFDGVRDGFFRPVLATGRVTGPVLVTCTHNDKAVGVAYPLASLLAGQDATALGDKNDLFGGIGANGAQHTPEAEDGCLLPLGGSYSFRKGRLYNLNADAFIKGHSDICKDEVAQALSQALATT